MTESKRTLHVRVNAAERTRSETRDAIRRLDAGESVADRFVLDLESEADLARLISEPNLELLRTIARFEPASMRETAALVDRDYRDVHRNLTELAAMNVVDLRAEGRSKRPIVRFDELEVEISVGPDPEDSEAAPA